jgi:hypothetical protein
MTNLTRQQAIDVNCRDSNFNDQDIGTLRDQIDESPSSQSSFNECRPVTNGDIETATRDTKNYTFSTRHGEG